MKAKNEAWLEPLRRELMKANAYVSSPFFICFSQGKLSRAQLKSFLIQHFSIIEVFPRVFSAIHSRCPVFEIRKDASRHLASEDLGYLDKGLYDTPDHMELFLRIGDDVGIARDEWHSQPLFPETRAFVNHYLYLGFHAPWKVAIGVLSLVEEQFVDGAKVLGEGLERHYGVKPSWGGMNYRVHIRAEELESKGTMSLIAKYVNSDEDRRALADEARSFNRTVWLYADGLYRHIIKGQPLEPKPKGA